ncbi:hypothetical protein FB567DRAFT_453313 [Paraphoma chrysanthemicola]|uniref:DNA-binding protein RAP1 n=1 Tax=Paraphoma chrysanthemicola TaxID=798071 RepID=A0A8K0VU43_9PLEO|nr:hypothetical protein FB567DRAFT_453313 [Paraphoma chrysanthemicola]
MAAPTVFNDVAQDFELEGVGQLFAGKTFWVAQRVPSRNRLLDEIKANGGEIVLLEKQADYRIADHFRKDCPPGSISYEFVEKSIQEGRIRDPEDHRAGPPLGAAREPGAINRPARGVRASFTPDEDRILYKWVRDCEKVGGLASGNEIYKQLEVQHPRHTWQSWRDRYLKQLRDRPPSAFNIPENAPPSPPSDTPTERQPPAQGSKTDTKTTAKQKLGKKSRSNTSDAIVEYSLEQLAATFNSNDWEEVYAFVDIIDAKKGDESYGKAWKRWAKDQDNQTAEQWRQYYEKVVRPQWLRDPEWKREQIKEKIEKKHENTKQSQTISQQQEKQESQEQPVEAESVAAADAPPEDPSTPQKPSAIDDERFEKDRHEQLLEARRSEDDDAAAYIFYARDKKWETWNPQPNLDYTQLHKLLMSQWQSLSQEDKAPYLAMNESTKKQAQTETSKLASEVKLMSSSTAQYESPRYIAQIHQNVLKRVRGDGITDEKGEDHRSAKRQKSASPVADGTLIEEAQHVTQQTIVEILSSDSSSSTPHPEEDDARADDQLRQEFTQRQHAEDLPFDDDSVESVEEVESIEADDFLDIDPLKAQRNEIEELSEDDLPSNTPTPRATRQRTNNFDTQAILSSPSQGIGITALPRPSGYTQDLETQSDHRSSSLAPHPESDASTTQSLQEFRHSLINEDTKMSYPTLPTLPRPTSLSPAPSNTSSAGSADPDVPLDASEFSDFFDEKQADGFSNEFITKALKRTTCRPGLAETVLDAWGQGKPLPNQRGIWSVEDDEAAEGGDGLALARLEVKHTWDGWGGVVERVKFLGEYRSR